MNKSGNADVSLWVCASYICAVFTSIRSWRVIFFSPLNLSLLAYMCSPMSSNPVFIVALFTGKKGSRLVILSAALRQAPIVNM